MKWILPLRYISLVASIFSLGGSLFLFHLGGYKTYTAIANYFRGILPEGYTHLSHAEVAVVTMVEAIDSFLFALVLLIFAFGIYRIFVLEPGQNEPEPDTKHRAWWQVNTVTELKVFLLEIIIVILAVLFLKSLLFENLSWEHLIFPLGASLLTGTLYLFKKMPH